MIYFIKKDGRYLTSLFPVQFNASVPVVGNVIFYRTEAIAQDIAKQLNATIETRERIER